MSEITFGFQAAAAGADGESDQELYQRLMQDCALGQKLGYDAAWLLEHHFSDYYPTPSPLLLMAHIAAVFPNLSLGTSVLVLPWYHPLRLAEEIAMLNSLTRGTLHLGIGRGTAKMEYDAYNVDMNEGRARFTEVFKVLEKGLTGAPFTHRGRFWTIDRPIRLRPAPVDKPVRFYGAIGSPASAEVMGDLGIAPICLSTFPDKLLAKILERWRARAGAKATGAVLPISVKMFIADTDEEARELGRRYYPAYFALQADHYEADANPWAEIPEYADFSRMFANLRKLSCGAWALPRRKSRGQRCDHLQAHRCAGKARVQLFHGVVRHAGHAVCAAPAHDDALRQRGLPAVFEDNAAEQSCLRWPACGRQSHTYSPSRVTAIHQRGFSPASAAAALAAILSSAKMPKQVGPLPDMAASEHPGCAASAALRSATTGMRAIAGRSRSLPRSRMKSTRVARSRAGGGIDAGR